jgi:siroheme synthase (precorrin-2 oxidase/ferrochelatase)
MQRIAVIGSGVVGLLAAHSFLKVGCSVDLYTDRSSEQWLNDAKPTGAAVRFGKALEYERELGLDFWNDSAPNTLFLL